MTFVRAIFTSSVGWKMINAVSGLSLIGFIIVHLVGNLILLTGDAQAFNEYSHFYETVGSLLYVVELMLVSIFIIHIITAVSVWISKQMGRDIGYKNSVSAGSPSKKTLASQTMIYSGAIILIFLILHLVDFKYGPHYDVSNKIVTSKLHLPDGTAVRDMHKTVIEVFQRPVQIIWYSIAVLLLGLHLRHGFWSAFQSLGINHPKYTPILFRLGMILGIIIGLGYLAIPVLTYLKGAAS